MSHPQIYMGRELFKPPGDGRNDVTEPFYNCGKSVTDYLDVFYRDNLKRYRAAGFKLMLDQVSPGIMKYIRDHDIKCIRLERSNNVKLAVSRLVARKTAVYHSSEDRGKPPIYLSPQALSNELSKIDIEKNVLQKDLSNINSITIGYEHFVRDREKQAENIMRFLSVKIKPVSSDLKKLNSDDLNLTILNYKEIYLFFEATKYSCELTPVRDYTKPYSSLHDAYKAIFIHVPKAAGTSVEKALWGTKGKIGHSSAVEYRQVDEEKYEAYFTFAIVRHPLDRFVSAYEYLRRGGRNTHDKAWSDKYIAPHSSFSKFVEALVDDPTRIHVLSWSHFKPQYLFVCDEKKHTIVDFIGRFENLNRDFAYIAKKLGIKVELPHENSVTRANSEDYFNQYTRQLVKGIYQTDMDLFGYE